MLVYLSVPFSLPLSLSLLPNNYFCVPVPGHVALHAAACFGHTRIVGRLLADRRVDVNKVVILHLKYPGNKRDAHAYAAIDHHVEALKVIRNDPRLEPINVSGLVHNAIRNLELLDILCSDERISLNDKYPENPLRRALAVGNIDAARMILSTNRVHWTFSYYGNEQCLMWGFAMDCGIDAVHLLLDHGYSLNPLQVAEMNGRLFPMARLEIGHVFTSCKVCILTIKSR